MFSPLQKFIPKAAAKYGVSREITAAAICYQFKKLLPELFPNLDPETATTITASYKDKILTIHIPTSAWAQEIHIRRQKIQDHINSVTSPDTVTTIKTQIT